MKIEEIQIWEAFQAVAMQGGFSKAARVLRIGVPQISKRIARLEDALQVRLFQRSTRVVKLTEEGRALLPKISGILEDLQAIEGSFEKGGDLSGTVRLTTVPFIAHRLLIPVITKFTAKHPEVKVELEVSQAIQNLVESNIDLAVRIHDEPQDSSLIYRKLAPNRMVFCASPAYLKANPSPIRSPKDLKNHDVLIWEIHRDLRFDSDGSKVRDWIRPSRIVCDDGWLLTQFALRGHGVLLRTLWDVKESLDQGELVEVLKKHPLESFGDVYAVIPSRRFLAPRVRAFLDRVVEESKGWG